MRAGETLRTTALISEAWLKLRRSEGWMDDDHFLHAAALAMRHVLVDHARARMAAKRGSGKIDALTEEERDLKAAELAEAAGKTPMRVSGVSGEGVRELLRAAWREVRLSRGELAEDDADEGDTGWTP